MDVPVNDSFIQERILIDPDIHGTVIFHDLTGQTSVTHFYRCENETYVNDTVGKLMSNQSLEIQKEGNVNFVKINSTNVVLFQEQNKVIIISSSKLDFPTLKSMVLSADFKN